MTDSNENAASQSAAGLQQQRSCAAPEQLPNRGRVQPQRISNVALSQSAAGKLVSGNSQGVVVARPVEIGPALVIELMARIRFHVAWLRQVVLSSG
jgi:hypothetical protein